MYSNLNAKEIYAFLDITHILCRTLINKPDDDQNLGYYIALHACVPRFTFSPLEIYKADLIYRELYSCGRPEVFTQLRHYGSPEYCISFRLHLQGWGVLDLSCWGYTRRGGPSRTDPKWRHIHHRYVGMPWWMHLNISNISKWHNAVRRDLDSGLVIYATSTSQGHKAAEYQWLCWGFIAVILIDAHI